MEKLRELVDRVNRNEPVAPGEIEPYLHVDQPEARFAAHRCLALLSLREGAAQLHQALRVSGFRDLPQLQELQALCSLIRDPNLAVQVSFEAGIAAAERGDDVLACEILQMTACNDIQAGIKVLAHIGTADAVGQAYDLIASRQQPFEPAPAATAGKRRLRVGYVVPNLIDHTNAPSQRILNFAKYHDPERVEMLVYSTEALTKRPKPLYYQMQLAAPTIKRAPQILGLLNEKGIRFYASPIDGDLIDSALAVGKKMRADGLDMAVYESSLACPPECIIANWRPAPVQVNMNIGVPMYVSGIDCTTYFMKSKYEREAEYFLARGQRSCFIHGGIDLDVQLPPAPTKQAMGIDENVVILVTVGNNLPKRMSDEFLDVVARVMSRHVNALYLVIGGGDFSRQKAKLQRENVLNRVLFLGPRTDVRHIVRIADVYVNEFPEGGAQSVMEAMAAGIPAVAMHYSDQHLHCCGAEYVGAEMTIASRDFDGYVDLVGRLVADVDFRRERGDAARRRVEELYSFRNCVRRFESLYLELYEQAARAIA